MRTVTPTELCGMDFNTVFLSVNKTKEKPDVTFTCTRNMRKWDRFFYVAEGEITFETSSGNVSVPAGNIAYIPYDTAYKSTWKNADEIGYVTAEFILNDTDGERLSLGESICIMTSDKNGKHLSEFLNLYDIWIKGELGYKIKAKSVFLGLLRDILIGGVKADIRSTHSGIYKAVIYIENNYLEEVSTAELAGMCGMCESRFRKLFRDYADMSPVKYKNHLRIRKAAELLGTGEYTVGEVAEMVSIPDLAYFNKLFKRTFGVNPKDVKK